MEAAIETFLSACETLNYRKTAEHQHLSQPAVTKQIQALEHEYGIKLFHYSGRRLSLTKNGETFREYALAIRRCQSELELSLRETPVSSLHVGVTKTIGDFLIGAAVAEYLTDDSRRMEITTDNTENLLKMLEGGFIDMAIVEGVVDKSRYQTITVLEEPFVGICGKEHPFAGKVIDITGLKNETVLIREAGSGTRALFEQELNFMGYSLGYFKRTVTVSNFNLIKYLVSAGTGISFSYRAVVENDDRFSTFRVKGFSKSHELNAVYLKHTELTHNADEFLKLICPR